jgi:hypothetical protein
VTSEGSKEWKAAEGWPDDDEAEDEVEAEVEGDRETDADVSEEIGGKTVDDIEL